MRLKVGDGDLIVVTIGGKSSWADMDEIKKRFIAWAARRGLQDTDVTVLANNGGVGVQIVVISVNDVFEDQVLNRDRNQ